MECSCDIEVDVDDPPEFHKIKVRKAIKTHKCTECGGEIRPGECYELFKGKWEGTWNIFKTCDPCFSLRMAFFPGGFYYGNVLEDIREFIYDQTGDIPETCISKLEPAARDWVCEIVEEIWADLEDDDEDL